MKLDLNLHPHETRLEAYARRAGAVLAGSALHLGR